MPYHATAATVGNSRGFRVDAAFFKAHPEFATGDYQVDVIAPGRMLVQTEPRTPDAEPDPVFNAFLGFMEREMASHPERIVPLTVAEHRKAAELVEGVVVDPEALFDDDFEMP